MADDPSREELLRREELARTVTRNHSDVTAALSELKTQLASTATTLINQIDRYVLTKVYDANEKARDASEEALKQSVKRLEDNETSNRRGNRTAVLACVGTVAASILIAVLTRSGVWH